MHIRYELSTLCHSVPLFMMPGRFHCLIFEAARKNTLFHLGVFILSQPVLAQAGKGEGTWLRSPRRLRKYSRVIVGLYYLEGSTSESLGHSWRETSGWAND